MPLPLTGPPPQAQDVSQPQGARQSPCPDKTHTWRVLCSPCPKCTHVARVGRGSYGVARCCGHLESGAERRADSWSSSPVLAWLSPPPRLAVAPLPRARGYTQPRQFSAHPGRTGPEERSRLWQQLPGLRGTRTLGGRRPVPQEAPPPARPLRSPGARGPCGSCLLAPPLSEGLGANTGTALTPLPASLSPTCLSVHHPSVPGGRTLRILTVSRCARGPTASPRGVTLAGLTWLYHFLPHCASRPARVGLGDLVDSTTSSQGGQGGAQQGPHSPGSHPASPAGRCLRVRARPPALWKVCNPTTRRFLNSLPPSQDSGRRWAPSPLCPGPRCSRTHIWAGRGCSSSWPSALRGPGTRSGQWWEACGKVHRPTWNPDRAPSNLATPSPPRV